jgi:small subunit ribosomal protein S20
MANHKSAIKKNSQDVARRERNRTHRSRMRTQIKKFRKLLEEGDAAGARAMLTDILSLVDRTARHGVIHGNAADRTKSRLTKAVARLEASA